ncbi:SDR family NAD(P)-dependent oxidoreductase [Streptomyces sp. NPDC014733]|uniref:SDR family NAD(P)-dependent oxidoreductase n=1 Tax=Streptomyces sp. NPDC014733 TaxID=3364885 RepID=UPI0037007473
MVKPEVLVATAVLVATGALGAAAPAQAASAPAAAGGTAPSCIDRSGVRNSAEGGIAGDTAVDRFGRLDVLASNAGTMAVSPFDELRQDDWDAMVATHITGLLNGIGAALPAVIPLSS